MELTSHREDFFGGAEAVGTRHTNGEPNHAEQEVDHIERHGDAEDGRVPPRREVVDGNRAEQNSFRHGPNKSPPFDVIVAHAAGKVDFPDSKLRDDIVSRRLECNGKSGGLIAIQAS